MGRYRIWLTPGEWEEVEGEPFNYPGCEHLGLFSHRPPWGGYRITEPQTGLSIVHDTDRCATLEAAREVFARRVCDLTLELIARSRDAEIQRRENEPIEVTLTIPHKVWDILARRAHHAIADYLAKRVIYDTTRKH